MDVARREAAFLGGEELPPETWMDEPRCARLDLMQALGWSLMEQKHRFLFECLSWPRWTAMETNAPPSPEICPRPGVLGRGIPRGTHVEPHRDTQTLPPQRAAPALTVLPASSRDTNACIRTARATPRPRLVSLTRASAHDPAPTPSLPHSTL